MIVYSEDLLPPHIKRLPPSLRHKCMSLEGHSSKITSLAISADSTYIITSAGSGGFGFKDNTLRVWDTRSQTQTAVLIGHTDRVTSLAVSPDSAFVFSGSFDRSVILWNIATKEALHKYIGHQSHVLKIALSGNGEKLASSSKDHTFIVWDVRNEAKILEINRSYGQISNFIFTKDNSRILLAANSNSFVICDIGSSDSKSRALKVGVETNIDCTADSEFMVYGNAQSVCYFEISKNKIEHQFAGHNYTVTFVAFLDQDKRILSSSVFGIRIWNIEQRTQDVFIDRIGNALGVNNRGDLAVSSYGKGIRVYSLESGKENIIFNCHHGIITGATTIPNSDYLITSAVDNYLKVWDMRTDKLVSQAILKTQSIVQSIAVSKTCKYFVFAMANGRNEVWTKDGILNDKRDWKEIKSDTSEMFEPKDVHKAAFELYAKMKL